MLIDILLLKIYFSLNCTSVIIIFGVVIMDKMNKMVSAAYGALEHLFKISADDKVLMVFPLQLQMLSGRHWLKKVVL